MINMYSDSQFFFSGWRTLYFFVSPPILKPHLHNCVLIRRYHAVNHIFHVKYPIFVTLNYVTTATSQFPHRINKVSSHHYFSPRCAVCTKVFLRKCICRQNCASEPCIKKNLWSTSSSTHHVWKFYYSGIIAPVRVITRRDGGSLKAEARRCDPDVPGRTSKKVRSVIQ